MPAGSLQVKSRKFTKFNAQQNEDTVSVNGEYTITVVNKGVLPVPSVSANINTVEYGGLTILEEKSKIVGTIGRGQEASVSFEFSYEDTVSDFEGKVCEGQTIEADVNETVSGIILAIVFDESVEVISESSTCNLSQPEIPPLPGGEPEPEPEPPNGDNGDGGGGGGLPPGFRTTNVDINGPTNPETGERVTYQASQVQGANVYQWTDSQSRASENQQVDSQNPIQYSTTFGETGQFTVEVTAVDSNGETIGEGSFSGQISQGSPDPINVNGPEQPTVGQEVTFQTNNVADAQAYRWTDSQGGSLEQDSNEYTTTFGQVGEYNVRVQVVDSEGQLIREGSLQGEVQPPDPVELEIDGAEEPLEDLDNTYDVGGEPDDTAGFVWTMPEGDAFDERRTQEDEITVVFEDPQYFTIEVESRNNRDITTGQGSIQGRVLDQFGGGDDPRDDTPPPRDASNGIIPSMSEAAEYKRQNRNF